MQNRVMFLKLENKIDVKVFILYLLNNVGEPLKFETVNDIVVQDEFVGYFDFAVCFSELLDKGQIEEYGIDEQGDMLYTVSETGKMVLESYESSILPLIKERALRSALRLLSYNRSGKRLVNTIEESHGGYALKCGMVDKEKTLFSVELFLQDKHYAEKLKANFDERAEIIFRGVLSLLSGDVNFIFDD